MRASLSSWPRFHHSTTWWHQFSGILPNVCNQGKVLGLPPSNWRTPLSTLQPSPPQPCSCSTGRGMPSIIPAVGSEPWCSYSSLASHKLFTSANPDNPPRPMWGVVSLRAGLCRRQKPGKECTPKDWSPAVPASWASAAFVLEPVTFVPRTQVMVPP